MQLQTQHKVERTIVLGFLLVILAGALLVWSCNHFVYGMPISAVDAIFMAMSAVCVTGLASVSVADQMGPLTQAIMLLLIQIGGLGIITAVTFLSLRAGHKMGIINRMVLMSSFGIDSLQGAIRFLNLIVRYTLSIELMGAALLYIGFILHGEPPGISLWHALFHSVSSFCNAGFSTFADNLDGFCNTLVVPLVCMSLIVAGGLGFPLYFELKEHFRKHTPLSHYAKLVLKTTGWLIFAGTALLLVSDGSQGLGGMPWYLRVWNAFFTSVTTRTAGYDTIPMSHFSDFGRAIMILLMIIGASPSSTGGGVKTTTFAVLWVAIKNELLGRDHDVLWHREIPYQTVRRALSLTVLFTSTLIIGATLLNVIEPMSYGDILFETASAIGTVGLSVGITPSFSPAGKIILSIIMFWGRVGLLTFFASILSSETGAEVRYAETNIPIG